MRISVIYQCDVCWSLACAWPKARKVGLCERRKVKGLCGVLTSFRETYDRVFFLVPAEVEGSSGINETWFDCQQRHLCIGENLGFPDLIQCHVNLPYVKATGNASSYVVLKRFSALKSKNPGFKDIKIYGTV